MPEEPAKSHGRKMGNQTIDALSLEETTQIIHDLHIHQAELEAKSDDLMKAQNEITRLRRDYADLFDITPIGLFMVCGQKRLIEKVNRVGAAMLASDKQSIEGKPFIAFVAPESATPFLDHFREVESSGKRQILELKIKRLGGDTFLAECDTTPIIDDGKFLYFRTVITDITDRKQSREAMLEKLRRK